MSFHALPGILQLAIALPLITLIFADCLTTLSHMYSTPMAQHSQFRDLFFIGAIFMCARSFLRTFAFSLTAVNEATNEKKESGITIIHMPHTPNKQEEATTATTTQATTAASQATTTTQATTAASQATTTTQATTKTTMQEDAPANAPTTPPPTMESKGPMQDRTMIY